jgi:hypothetical protein
VNFYQHITEKSAFGGRFVSADLNLEWRGLFAPRNIAAFSPRRELPISA